MRLWCFQYLDAVTFFLGKPAHGYTLKAPRWSFWKHTLLSRSGKRRWKFHMWAGFRISLCSS